MKLYKKVAAVLLACLLALSLAACGGGGGGGGGTGSGGSGSTMATNVEINETSFPNLWFRFFVTGQYDKDLDGVLSADEIKEVTKIDVSGNSITDLTGIEYFAELTELNCSNNSLTKLNVSQNTKLTTLNCSGNQITALDVSNTKITKESGKLTVDSGVNVTYAGGSATTEPDSSATTEPDTNENDKIKWKYSKLSDGTIHLTGYDKSGPKPSGQLVLPAEVDGYKVVGLINRDFKGNTDITSVIVPDTYTYLGIGSGYVFADCTNLTSVVLPEGLQSIGSYAFANTGLRNVTLPSTLSYFWGNTFRGCKYLTTVTIKSKVIENYGFASAFMDCTSLTTVNFPETVECKPNASYMFSSYMFSGCTSLESVTLPKGLTMINEYAFSNCTSLKKVSGLTTDITRINQYAFENCTSLTTLEGKLSSSIVIEQDGNDAFINAKSNMK